MEDFSWWAELNSQLTRGEDLPREIVKEAVLKMLTNITDPNYLVPIIGFIASFTSKANWKGYTEEEIAGLADGIESLKTFRYHFRRNKPLVFILGSGGDTFKTFNISTGAAMVAAAAGALTPKVGGPTVTSPTGSAQVAETLGFNVKTSQQSLVESIEELGFAFLELDEQYPFVKTIVQMKEMPFAANLFIFFSPLRMGVVAGLNPLDATRGVKGLNKPEVEIICRVLAKRKYEWALVPCGFGPNQDLIIDEFSVAGKTKVAELREGKVETYELVPEEVGLKTHNLAELAPGKTHEENASYLMNILSGRDRGAKRDAVLFNAAAALYLAEVVKDLRAGVSLAAQVIDEGKVVSLMEEVILKTKGDIARFRSYLA